ncbi:trimeric intracellular cation channel family protein [Luteibacter sp. UNCMF366Tsu5.1]|uniref:trimeric intracellular cation channel family protein n=1 Tax=Luteibacter sp. UNCMF366Tsu5.1 TaxID=1502758 RepID=UPI0009089D93|nr:trimeric intracellular cation channel family protein [Luteibacter sp. UNCMF366Tsu5.1]SFW57573.1 Uncharacterized membrane protein YeiH [Luteibacter sp. UNCMF366Tsu5.1]
MSAQWIPVTRRHVVLAGDLAGTVVFAVEGAIAAIHGGLDLLGVLVLSFIVALGGGVVRDVLIGATPPNAIRDWRYPTLAFAAGLVTFAFHAPMTAAPPMVLLTLDAAGLAIFAATGAEKAWDYGITPINAILMGAVTGCGGGVIRDLLLTRTPLILMADIYATAALLGAAVVIGCRKLQWPPAVATALGCLVCFAVRMAAVAFGWQLPRVA